MMNEVITIENTEMRIKEYNGQRVVTFKDIDTVHQRPTGTARRSFNKNKKHFIEGEDYIKICVDEIRTHKLFDISNKARADIVVLTESGYLMITKSLTDDLSWNVQRQLVNAYFKVKEQQPLIEYVAPIIERKVSSVPAPRNMSWFYQNKFKIDKVCKKAGCKKQKLFHFLLTKLGEEFDLETAKLIYIEENGYPPIYAMDIANYFPDIAERATYILNRLYKAV